MLYTILYYYTPIWISTVFNDQQIDTMFFFRHLSGCCLIVTSVESEFPTDSRCSHHHGSHNRALRPNSPKVFKGTTKLSNFGPPLKLTNGWTTGQHNFLNTAIPCILEHWPNLGPICLRGSLHGWTCLRLECWQVPQRSRIGRTVPTQNWFSGFLCFPADSF